MRDKAIILLKRPRYEAASFAMAVATVLTEAAVVMSCPSVAKDTV